MLNNTKRLLLAAVATLLALAPMLAEHLVIIAANDTHSQIEVASDGLGGIARRRALYDKIRRENKHTLTVHAGDAVQGTVFFLLYGGEVEYALLDSLGYDLIILGNHEFDNGMESTASYYRNVKAKKLSANYGMSGTPFDGMFEPFVIKRYGDKHVGFIGINVQPEGLISLRNFEGMRYLPSIDVADATARYLKEVQKVDYVVMISHIGYTSYDPGETNDVDIIRSSRYIDLVIGGHSHTVVKPGSEMSLIKNADGRLIPVGQNGKSGKMVSTYDLDLETGRVKHELHTVDASWDEAAKTYTAMNDWLDKYRHGVDSLVNNPLCVSARLMKNSGHALQNWVCDVTMDIIKPLSGIDDVQLAIMNKGGIRTDMPQGVVTEGQLMSMFPFDNRFVVLEITGRDLLDAIKVMAGRDGDAVSKQLKITYNDNGDVLSAKLNGKNIDPKKTYKMATIDYLANGGDYMEPLKKAKRLFVDEQKYGDHIITYVKQLSRSGKKIDASDESRMKKK